MPKAQGTLWARLGNLPKHFVLYGGTALALQLGHRKSVDLDFFSAQPVEPRRLYSTLDFLAKGRITQEERNTLMALSYPPTLEGLPAEDCRLLARAVEEIQNVPAVEVEPLGRIGEVAPAAL